jgi:hypothetical protein
MPKYNQPGAPSTSGKGVDRIPIDNTNSIDYMTRTAVFKDLVASQVDSEANKMMFEHLLGGDYDKYVAFCEEVKRDPRIKSVSAFLSGGRVTFEKKY